MYTNSGHDQARTSSRCRPHTKDKTSTCMQRPKHTAGEPTQLGFLQTRWAGFEQTQVDRRPTRRPTLRQTTHQQLFVKRCAAFRSAAITITQQITLR